MNNVEKYYWIIDHPRMNSAYGSSPVIEFSPHMVNPLDNTINLIDKTLNTKQQWWVEVMVPNPEVVFPHGNSFDYYHNYLLDCGGDTAEEAVEELYKLVKQHYGDY